MGRSRLIFDERLMQILAVERAHHVRQWEARMAALEACASYLVSGKLIDAIYVQGEKVATLARRQRRPVQTLYNRLNFVRRTLAECVRQATAEAAS